jgi:HAE1 family hydrophobic/amphiphilic exporter-1
MIGQSSNNVAELNITLYPKNERKRSTDEVGVDIKRQIAQIPGVKVRANPIGIFGTANQTPIQLVVSAPTYEEARMNAENVANVLRRIPGTADVRLNSEEGKPEMRVEIDRQKMAALGLTVADVGATLRVALSGDDESKFRDGSNEYTLRVQYDEFDRSKTSDVGSITFVNRKGELVELKQFATIAQTNGPTRLGRENRNYAVTVFSQAVGRASGDIGGDIKQWVAGNPLPTGVQITYRGDLQNQAEGFSSLLLAFAAAILFVYLIMVALYNSWVYPLVVLFSIPVALIGALLALALTMKTLSIFSLLGFIMLVGLVGKNAILLVDRTNQMRAEKGLSVIEALQEAAETRLRPIMMTTMTMVFGMSPIALSTSAGSEWKSGLASALIGGLISSLLLTLVLVPVMYVKFDEWRVSVPAFFRGIVAWLKRRRVRTAKPSVAPKPVPALEFSESK